MLSGKEITGGRLLLNQAGMRSRGAYTVYLGFRWALPVVFVVLAVIYGKATGITSKSITLLVLAAGIVGFLLPDFVLRSKIRKRQEEITDSLPDALDLLVVCVEAGLGLNAAFIKITEEFQLSSPSLSEEFDIVNREMVAGKPRQEALRALTERTGVEDVKSLVAMLIQTEKLGTSLAQSLRVHSDSLRMRRRQKAEEAAAKTTIKLVFPLVFLMFPALFIVILGPGVIQVIKILLPTINR
jgi:tight adherence protein C